MTVGHVTAAPSAQGAYYRSVPHHHSALALGKKSIFSGGGISSFEAQELASLAPLQPFVLCNCVLTIAGDSASVAAGKHVGFSCDTPAQCFTAAV